MASRVRYVCLNSCRHHPSRPYLARSSVHQRLRLVGRMRVPQLSVMTGLSSVCSM